MSFRDALNLAALAGSGLIAGVFFAFSAFVLRALAKLPPANGMAAMQSVTVVDRWSIGNHVRTVAALLATVGFAMAFRAPATFRTNESAEVKSETAIYR
jgi:uncharacterized membrane protein